MATAGPDTQSSRRSQTKCPDAQNGRSSASEATGQNSNRDLPTVEERVSEFYDLYPDRAETFVLHDAGDDPLEAYGPNGVTLREEATELTDGGDRYPLTWGGVVREHLEWYESCRSTSGRFSNGEESFEKPLYNSFDPEYLEKWYAQLMGLHRAIESEYSDPHTAMLTLTASGRYEDGSPRGPVDHQLGRRRAWDVTRKELHRVTNALEESGRIEDSVYIVVEEHHPGPFKENSAYGHDHLIVIADGELRERDLAPVVDKWVEACDAAGEAAHDLDHPDPSKRPVKIRKIDSTNPGDPGVINSAAGYLTKYLYPDGGDADPLERDIEQIAYHAIKWATNTRRFRKSDAAGEAIKADLCRQKYERGARVHNHGERLAHRESGRGPDIVCAGCGSSWGVDGAEGAATVVEARRGADAPREAAAASVSAGTALDGVETDGGRETAETWRDATARASSSGPSWVRQPDDAGWRLEAILKPDRDDPDGERLELTPGRSSGVETVKVLGWAQMPLGSGRSRRQRDRRGGDVQRAPDLPNRDRFGETWSNPPPHDGYSQKGRFTMVRRAVRELAAVDDRGAFAVDVVDQVTEAGVDRDLAERALRKMIERGELFQPDGARVLPV